MTDEDKKITALEPEKWETRQRILVILAHPDDPEFFCGGSIARWTAAGHELVYWLLTCGDKGTSDLSMTSEQVCGDRHVEQRNAAAVLGVHEVNFLDLPDGYLVPDMELRRRVVGMIRREKPDILVTCDPTTLFIGENRINHPDHRAAGQVVLDAVFPAAHMHLYFPELLSQGLEPHQPREVWVCGSLQPTLKLDVTAMWETKIKALFEHASQIGEPAEFAQRMRERRSNDSTPEEPRYEEGFRRIVWG
jgi:LmbE family N-acetylglucosaminyl deacetylase